MPRELKDVIAAMPPDSQRRIEARYQELLQEVKGLRALRRIAGKAQADIASSLKIKQPSVSKIEQQTDMYLSTLRNYVEAVGGQLELVVTLPRMPALRINSLGDMLDMAEPSRKRTANPTPRRSRVTTRKALSAKS